MEVTLAFRKSVEDSTFGYEGMPFDVPALPRPGDRISFHRQGKDPRHFIVKEIVRELKTSVEANIETVSTEIIILCDQDPKPSETIRERT